MEERTNRDGFPPAAGLYLAFCGVVTLSNGIATLGARTAGEALEALSGLILFIVGMAGMGLEKLKGDRAGQHSIRINKRWRVCFEWRGKDAYNVEIVDYH